MCIEDIINTVIYSPKRDIMKLMKYEKIGIKIYELEHIYVILS